MPPTRPCGFAILGTGMISKFHARALLEISGARLIAVCSRDLSRAEAFAAEFGCRPYDQLETMLACPGVDVLVIATPSGTHMEAAVLAARAGKHVLCEKPLEVTLERVDTMIAAHREANTELGCTFQIRYDVSLHPIREALRQGRFGTLTYAGVYVPWWRSEEYYADSSWHGKKELDGGGALMNQAIHMIDLLCDLMPPVESVTGYISTVGHPGIETEDTATAAVRFEGGAVGVIYGSTASWPGQPKRMEISGTHGTAVWVDDQITVFDFRDKRADDSEFTHRLGNAQTAHGARQPSAMSHALHALCFRDFIDALTSGVPFRACSYSARRPVALIHAIYEAARTGSRITL